MMATVRHSSCRIDFDPADITSKARVTISDTAFTIGDTGHIDVKVTHLIGAVLKLIQVQVRRNLHIGRLLEAADLELSTDEHVSDACVAPGCQSC